MSTRIHHESRPYRTDPLAVLTALRPQPPVEQTWSRQEQAAARQRILTTTGRGTSPAVPARAKRRRAAAVAVSGLVLIGGAGGAAAGGVVPQAFIDAFTPWRTNPTHSVEPSTAHRVASAPGPHGTVFTVMAAHAADDPGYQCMVMLYETPDSTRQPGPAAFQEASGNWCQDGPTRDAFGAGASVDVTDGTCAWSAPAGDAVTAQVQTASGRTYPVVRYDGLLFGWFPALQPGEAHPVLTGYTVDGTETGRTTL